MTMTRRTFVAGLPLVTVAACAGEKVWAPDDQVAAMAYREPGPAKLTLMTVKNTGSGNGAHTGLMINASQRVLWDPAGSFKHPSIPERNDLIYGVNPQVLQFYLSYHSRVSYYTVIQELEVAPEVAEMAFREAQVAGPIPNSNCTRSTGQILQKLPGFGNIRVSLFPNNLHDQFAKLPGVVTSEYREQDADDRTEQVQQIDAAIRAGQ